MKGLAILLLITGIIVSAVVANANPIIGTMYSSYFKADTVTSTSFNFWLFLAGCVASLFPFGILYSIGKILELLENIAEQKGTKVPTSELPTSDLPSYASRIQPESPNVSVPASEKGRTFAHCKSCGEDTPKDRLFCIYCGNKI